MPTPAQRARLRLCRLAATGRAADINVYTPPNAPRRLELPAPLELLRFRSRQPVGPIGQSGQSAQFHRILAYVGVPSPFVHMSGTASRAGSISIHWSSPRWIFPNREPGSANLNTISSSDVFAGDRSNHPVPRKPTWDSSAQPAGREPGRPGDQPEFPQPLHAAVPHARRGGAFRFAFAAVQDAAEPHEIDYTLLRPDPDNPNRPLFQVDDVSMASGLAQRHRLQPQFLFPLSGHAAVGRGGELPLQRLRRLDHGGLLRGQPAANPGLKDSFGNPVYPDGINWARNWAATTATSSAIAASTSIDRSQDHRCQSAAYC